MSKIAILGYGTVGSGVYEVLCTNAKSIAQKAAEPVTVAHILDIRDFPEHPEKQLFTKSFDDILNDDSVSIVVEVMGGVEPAYTFTKQALLKGKHVVTSNKELVATKGEELLAIAKEKNINYMFEASVGGGIPVIRPMNQCLAANRITEIMGILNGTTNYILTEMINKGQTFSDALKQAQDMGYAEKNPAADVEGMDTCRKIAILTSLVYGRQVDSAAIPTEGITNIEPADVAYAAALDSAIKLVGYGKLDGDKVYARVSPMLVGKQHPLYNVEDVFNAVLLKGNAVGDVLFYGRGAGKLPTASAVVADVIDITRSSENRGLFWEKGAAGQMADPDSIESAYLVRVLGDHADSVKAAFGDVQIVTVQPGEFAFVSPRMTEKEFTQKAAGIGTIVKKMHIAE